MTGIVFSSLDMKTLHLSTNLSRFWTDEANSIYIQPPSPEVDAAWDPQGSIEEMALSPDGKALAATLGRGGRTDIWVKQLPSGPFSRITFGDTSSVRPAWSPDGKEVLSLNDRAGQGVGGLRLAGFGRHGKIAALERFGCADPDRFGGGETFGVVGRLAFFGQHQVVDGAAEIVAGCDAELAAADRRGA